MLSIGGLVLATVVGVPVALGLLPLAWAADRLTGRSLAPALALVAWYLLCSTGGVVAAGWLWLRAGGNTAAAASQDAHHRLQHAWAGLMFAGVRRLFRLELEVQGAACAARGPLVLLCRHVSSADTLLPMVVVARPHGLRARYVMKRELLWEPCLDLVGQRIPNAFVRRGGADSGGDLARVAALARGLGSQDVVVIFPEGTRFTTRRRARLIQKFADQGDTVRRDRAEALVHVLPVQSGGLLAVLDRAPGVALVVCAHAGLEGLTSLASVWDGSLVGRRLRVRLWRTEAAEVPEEREAREAWLHDQWRQVDAWVGGAAGG